MAEITWPRPLIEAADHARQDPHSGFHLFLADGAVIGVEPGDALLTVELLRDAKDRLVNEGRYIKHPKEAIPDPVVLMAWLWLDHAEHHVGATLNAYLRGGATGVDPVRAALVTVQAIAKGLETAASYLDQAASRLKTKSDAHGASVTHEHAQEVWASHRAIVSDPEPDPQDGDPFPWPGSGHP